MAGPICALTLGAEAHLLENDTFKPFDLYPYDPRYRTQLEFLRYTGFNTVRLVLSWKGIQPVANSYNDAYIKGVVATITDVVSLGGIRNIILVFDLREYGIYTYGAGVPDWAIPLEVSQSTPLDYAPAGRQAQWLNLRKQTVWQHFWLHAKTAYVDMLIHTLTYITDHITSPCILGVQAAAGLGHIDSVAHDQISARMVTDYLSLHSSILERWPQKLQRCLYIIQGYTGIDGVGLMHTLMQQNRAPPVQYVVHMALPADLHTAMSVRMYMDQFLDTFQQDTPIFMPVERREGTLNQVHARLRILLELVDQHIYPSLYGWVYIHQNLFPVNMNIFKPDQLVVRDEIWRDTLYPYMVQRHHLTGSTQEVQVASRETVPDPFDDDTWMDNMVSSRHSCLYTFWIGCGIMYVVPCLWVHMWNGLLMVLLLISWCHLMLGITSEMCPPLPRSRSTLHFLLSAFLILDAAASLCAGFLFLVVDDTFSLWCGTGGLFWGFMGTIVGVALTWARKGLHEELQSREDNAKQQ